MYSFSSNAMSSSSSAAASAVQSSEIHMDGEKNEYSCPSGFKFCPNDRQLVRHYLKNKIMGLPQPANLIKDLDICEFNPEQISMDEVRYGKKHEVFYFTSRDWSNFNGTKTSDGHWEATGEDEKIVDGDEVVGFKKMFVFCWREELIEMKNKWIMQEYRINPSICSSSVDVDDDKNMIAKMDHYVLCRIKEQCDSEDDIEDCEYCRDPENQDDNMEDIQSTMKL